MVHEFKSTMDRNFVNGYLGIDESYKMPERMMELLLNAEEREKMFDAFSAENPDMTGDLWHEYFQDEQGDRNALKQDFTPMEICQLVAEITPEAESYADVCAGTGGLTIALHNRFPDAYYHLEEISERTIPILLFNLAIRNINAEVINGDSLEQTAKHYYRVVPGRKYGLIDEVDGLEPRSFGAVVSNPPYIASEEIKSLDPSVKDFEPVWALDGGEDGLKFYKSIIKYWKSLLRPGGWLLFEVGEGQSADVRDMLRSAGFDYTSTRTDTLGIERVVFGRI